MLKVIASESLWMTVLKKTISMGGNVFVYCCQPSDAEALYRTVINGTLCKPLDYSSVEWHDRVALVTGLAVFPKGEIDGVNEFNSTHTEFDQAIVTSLLETGVSLSGQFTHVFAHFMRKSHHSCGTGTASPSRAKCGVRVPSP
jgi:hypothetical protein